MSLEFNRPGGLCLEGNLSENFKIFKPEVLIYFKATETNKKDIDVQVARLLNLLGHDGIKLYNTIKKEEQETVDAILQSLELYCIPKANEIIEHFNFFNRKQNEGEQFDIWYTDLKKLIKGCNFGEAENKILRTQIVLGIFDKETQTRLLRDDVVLDKVVTYCQSIERAESNRRTLSSTKDVDKVVHGVGFKSKWRAKDMEKINNSNQNQWKGNTANDRQMETTEEKDSGAEVNTLSEKDCEKLNLMKEIKKPNIVLEVYGGFKMKPIGVVKAILSLGDQNIETEFVRLDLKDGYYHIKLDKKSSKYCTFSTPFGNYRFLRLAFGLSVAPELFMKQNQKYFGDIEGRARQYNIKFNLTKLQYSLKEVKFMGLKFNEKGMSPDEERIKVIKQLQIPHNKKELQQILGVVNFLRQFLPNLSEIIGPMRELLKKEVLWNWTKVHTNSLEKVKSLISEKSLLVHFDAKQPVQIQSLTETEQMYAVIEKELLAITYAVKKFHYYIYGHNEVKIYTDHQPLVSIVKNHLEKIENNRLKQLKLKLINYYFTLEYLPGRYMYIADLLTRNIIYKTEKDDESLKDLIHTVKIAEIKYSTEKQNELKLETNRDMVLLRVKEYSQHGWPNKIKENNEINHFYKLKSDLSIENGLVYYENRVIIPKILRSNMLKKLHDNHQGVSKTICLLARSNKRNELLNYEIPKIPFDKVGADIAHYGGKDYLVVVDYFSRWVEISKLKWKTATELSKKCKKIFARFGIPNILIADNKPFNRVQFRSFAKEWGFQINNTSPNHPMSNGLSEKYVGLVIKMIKKCKETNDELEDYLLTYRNTPLVNVGQSPANLIQNRMIENQNTQKRYFDQKGTLKEMLFEVGEKVWLQDKFNETWNVATIIKKLELPRCYLVRDEKGKLLRRNIFFLRKRKTFNLEFEEEEEI
ncbi:Uncharacterized protein FWK35_00028159 [Aphis craccivora]|uniref:Integrase catalytic domain-containing protein n=1 Tax=Aphis craccivora TaxID=307492 RepID=A0A6G0XGW3_APHCR|nr:Uncharacterized protein FWK35_00028159 [Aphis craccivora]